MAEDSFDGKLLVITAPSGAGKTTLVKHLLTTYQDLDFSVSATTRNIRPNEVDGRDYYFMDAVAFKKKVRSRAFIEWEEVYDDQYYGTLRSEVDRLWRLRKHILFDIDVKGAVSIKKKYGDRCLTVFIKPPSLEILIERLKNRKTENEESLKKRIRKVKRELKYESKFDRVIVNDLLEVAYKEAEIIVETFLNIKEA